MTPCGIFFLTLLVIFTAFNLAGFWICRKDFDGFWDYIFPVTINIGTVVVSWAVVLITLAGRGEI